MLLASKPVARFLLPPGILCVYYVYIIYAKYIHIIYVLCIGEKWISLLRLTLDINNFWRNCILRDILPQVSCNLLSVLLGMPRFQGHYCSLLRPFLRIVFAARKLDRWDNIFLWDKEQASMSDLRGIGNWCKQTWCSRYLLCYEQ